MADALRYVGQAAVYGLIALALGYFSDSPAYTHFPPDQALVKLSLVHPGAPAGECRRRTADELAQLAPNMRKVLDCPRGRLPLLVELSLDGALLYRESLPPTGLSGDGPSRTYQRFTVAPGRHRLAVRLRDSARTEGFDYEREADIELVPRQSLAIDFQAETGGFAFR
ncbi:MAG: hypothetical protein WEC41_02220 [Dongiaceae bacterium]